jgi:hypothetical protein
MKYIDQPYLHKATTQAFSCFEETRIVDFTKAETRDEVSFYKKLARIDQAKALGLDPKEYDRLLKLHKSGKYNVNFVKPVKKSISRVARPTQKTEQS